MTPRPPLRPARPLLRPAVAAAALLAAPLAAGDACDPAFVTGLGDLGGIDFDIAGDLLIEGRADSGLAIHTLAAPGSPESPLLIATLDMPLEGFANFVAADGNLALVSTYPAGFLVDLSSPSSPFVAAQVSVSQPVAMAIEDDLALIVSPGQGTRILDLTDPGAVQDHVLQPQMAEGLGLDGGIGYVVTDGVLRSYDLTDPATPMLLDELAGMGQWTFRPQMAFANGRMYYASRDDGIFVVDVSDPSNLGLLAHVLMPGVWDIDVEGHLAYVANATAEAFQVLDLNDPAPTVPVLGSVTAPLPRSIRYEGGLIYTKTGSSALAIHDVTACPVPPIVTTAPASALAEAGGPAASFEVDATYALAYQWRRNGVPILDGADFDGTTTAVLTVLPSAATEGIYDVVVTNAQGAVTSDPAVLGVVEGGGACPSDLDGSGAVDFADLLELLVDFGPCG